VAEDTLAAKLAKVAERLMRRTWSGPART
jgi:hypothetical protein